MTSKKHPATFLIGAALVCVAVVVEARTKYYFNLQDIVDAFCSYGTTVSRKHILQQKREYYDLIKDFEGGRIRFNLVMDLEDVKALWGGREEYEGSFSTQAEVAEGALDINIKNPGPGELAAPVFKINRENGKSYIHRMKTAQFGLITIRLRHSYDMEDRDRKSWIYGLGGAQKVNVLGEIKKVQWYVLEYEEKIELYLGIEVESWSRVSSE